MADLTKMLPKMLFGDELKERMTVLPEYSPFVRGMDAGERLVRLTDIYKVFLPGNMSAEIYHKLYMMCSMSLLQKGNADSIRQLNGNHRQMNGGEFKGVITGATSATIIGSSGIGKTSSIQASVDLLGGIMESKKPYQKIIPCILVSTPFDCNYKGLLLQILLAIDKAIGTDYNEKCTKSRANAQQIMGLVCNLLHIHVGVLILDEIQMLITHRAGVQLYQMILELINMSGVNFLLVGTNECLDFFTGANQIARRTSGLRYGALEYGGEFHDLCDILFRYQYVKNRARLDAPMEEWLYEHSGGNVSNLVSLIHDAQEIAIISGKEVLSLETLAYAYEERMQMLHPYIAPTIKKNPQVGRAPKKNNKQKEKEIEMVDTITIAEMVAEANETGADILNIMREHFRVEEVAL